MYLVKNGVPFDVAFAADDERALAMYVVLGEFEGNTWDWDAMNWIKRG